MRAVYTQYEGGVLGPQGLHAGRRERQKATRTHAQHMLARHRHTSQHGCTWPHKKREAGGCSGRGTGGLGAGHTDMNAWLFPLSHMCTREQHTALPHRGVARWEGQQAKVETQHKGNRKQYQQGTKQHIRCVTALGEERGVCGCGLWGTALVQCWGGPITGTTEPRGLDGVGGGGEKERERMRPTDQTPAMWKEVPHNRVSNRAVCRKRSTPQTHQPHTGAPTHGGTHPRHHQIPAPKTRSTEACQTQQPLTTKWGSHMQRGHAELSHFQQHMTHVRTVRAITA